MEQQWFEMQAERRRPHSEQTWIPLRSFLGTEQGEQGQLGFLEDVSCATSVAVSPAFRAAAEALRWGEAGLSNTQGVYVFGNGRYKTADAFQIDEGDDAGFHLVLAQSNLVGDQIWHLHQDLVFALGLIEEGDSWVKPDENFAVAAKRIRRPDGSVGAIHMRTDFLRDYLCARGMALRLLTYRQRLSVEASADHITWPEGRQSAALADGRFEGFVGRILPGGDRADTTVAVFHVRRTDVDVDADIPVMGPETEEGTEFEHSQFVRTGETLYRISGETWRSEWIEPAQLSPRVRGDEVPSETSFIVDAAGNRRGADDLNDEDVGLWLWFDPAIVRDLLALRVGRLQWYTQHTGGLDGEAGHSPIHFGVNDTGLINVYARDVARLSEWHRRIWAGRNLYPNGGLCAELRMAHVEGRAADTTAPETRIAQLLSSVDSAASEHWGFPIFRSHALEGDLLNSLHRFRGVDRSTLLDLAKDVARLTADRIDSQALKHFAPVTPALPGTGSLKCLERALALQEGAARARQLMGPLFGLYELRLGAAHLPGSEIQAAFGLVGIDPRTPIYTQTLHLLTTLAQCLENLEGSIRASAGAATTRVARAGTP